MVDYSQKGDALFIDDEMHVRISGSQTLELAGFQVSPLENAQEALEKVKSGWTGIVISDVKMPEMDGMAFLSHLQDINPDIPVILITGHGDVEMAVNALKIGAYDFLEKPFASERLIEIANRAQEKHDLLIENKNLRARLETGSDLSSRILGKSAPIRHLLDLIKNIAPTQSDVLITGETGSGKELIAQCLHDHSSRRHAKFVSLNCAALPKSLFEKELFGIETNPSPKNMGKFEQSSGGTLYIEEIEALDIELQVALLKVIEEGKIKRQGSNNEIPLDLRIVVSTKTDLLDLCKKGLFREDLYYRLSVVQIDAPPLRVFKEDIPSIFHTFLEESAQKHNKSVPDTNPKLLNQMMDHDWPGNILELKNRAEGHVLNPDGDVETISTRQGLGEKVEAFEKSLIIQALTQTSGSIKDAMDILSIPRKTLTDKMRRYGINRKDFI